MAQESRATIKGYFNTGDTPTETQFHNLMDSVVWYDEGGASQPSRTNFSFTAGIPAPGDIDPVGVVSYWGDAPTITNPSQGLFLCAFADGSFPEAFRLTSSSTSFSGGSLTLRFTLANTEISCIVQVKRADATNQIVHNPNDQNVQINESVAEGQTNLVFNNLTNINKVDILIKFVSWQ